MEQLELIPMAAHEKGKHGAVWWAGNWECRNFDGYFQTREGGRGAWRFVIYGFGDEDVSVYAVNPFGEIILKQAPIDKQDRISVLGKRYGRDRWQH